MKSNAISDWNYNKKNKANRNKSYNNTLIPRDTQTDNIIESTQVEITDGRMTANPMERYPEEHTLANSSIHESWALSKAGYYSPFVNKSLKKRKRAGNYEADFRSKISSYRQQYYEHYHAANLNNNIDGSMTDGEKFDMMTGTTRGSAVRSRAADRLKKPNKLGP